MRRILYNMEFKGRGEQETDGEMLWITRSFAPCVSFTTEIDADGVDARIEQVAGPQAEFNSKVTAHDRGELGPGKKFREWGTVSFGNGNVLNFDTVGAGEFGPVGDEGLMQGGIVWAVDGGSGLFENAKGIITSNFA
ncbi:MAG TPA: hypothetical protein EYM34_10145, partial [Alphaproteobacteria bacterium]|nr:hypothetical protein [Alphaproteobacteria bacterium]